MVFDVIASELQKRALGNQAEIAAFVKKQVGYRIRQQMVSKILTKKIKKPRESSAVLAMLFALGRDAAGKPLTVGGFNEEALRISVRALDDAIADLGEELTSEGRAIGYAFVYRVQVEDGKLPSRATILEFLRYRAR